MSDMQDIIGSDLNFDQKSKPEKYHYSHIDVSYVADNIDEYIIPECQQACRLLWDKNIFTSLCTNYDNDYTAIAFAELSVQNQTIFYELSQSDSRFTRWRGCSAISVEAVGPDVAPILNGLTEPFRMQDVMSSGFYTIQEFLVERGCYNIIDNPAYVRYDTPKDPEDLQSMIKHMEDYNDNTPYVYVFDETKVSKPIEEYLKEVGLIDFYIPFEGKIYKNEFYFNAHKKYLSYIGMTSLL